MKISKIWSRVRSCLRGSDPAQKSNMDQINRDNIKKAFKEAKRRGIYIPPPPPPAEPRKIKGMH